MFGFSGSTGVGLDPEKERKPPPLPTPVIFPENKLPDSKPPGDFQKHLPDLFHQYCSIQKPSDICQENLTALNLQIQEGQEPEDIIPASADGLQYLPPRAWLVANEPGRHQSSAHELFSQQKNAILSNGHKTPSREDFIALTKELTCESEDAYRVVARRKARPGFPAPKLSNYRRFWIQLDLMSHYWDSSLDNYIDRENAAPAPEAPLPPPPPVKGLKRLSLSLAPKSTPPKATGNLGQKKAYTGRRLSTGNRMPEPYRIDTVRSFVDPIARAFGCDMLNPRRVPHLEIKTLLIPVTQSAIVWRTPQDKNLLKRGLVEGPLLGVQCRAETEFADSRDAALLDIAREISGLLLLAQQRARESKQRFVPGLGKWWTTVPRWGGGPGGEFGEAEGNTDAKMSASAAKKHPMTRKKTEEEIWRELRPGIGEWDSRMVYVTVGKDSENAFDRVYMVSSIFHHISILRLQVHAQYMEYLNTGKVPRSEDQAELWSSPTIQRTRWYDLLVPADRGEALRCLWGIMTYMMRPGAPGRPQSQRQLSEASHGFSFRKKPSIISTANPMDRQKAHSVAF